MMRLGFRSWFLLGSFLVGAALTALFLSAPAIDLVVASWIRLYCFKNASSDGWCGYIWLQPLRDMFIGSTVMLGLAAVLALLRGQLTKSRLFGLTPMGRTGLLFVVTHFALSVGLIANVVLKDHWGRARPFQTVAFGGTKQFTPPLLIAGQCPKNCSFVSGEATAVYAPFFAAAVLVPSYGVPFTVAGIVAGTAAGLVRMAQGRHFLSDVLFAGVFSALSALGLYALCFGRINMLKERSELSGAPGRPLEVDAVWHAVSPATRQAHTQHKNGRTEPLV